MNRYRLIVIGWDGATWDLLRPWAEAGYLPALARMMAEGCAGNLETIFPPTTAPAWTSLVTGTNPGKHGLMDWIMRRPGSYRSMPVTALHCTQKSIWELMSAAGRRVFTFNVPMTYPVRPLNGLVVAGLGVPTVDSEFTFPAELKDEIARAVGEYILHPNPGQPHTDREMEGFLERLYRVTAIHLRTLDLLRSKERWDAWMAVFSGTDAIQHVMWRFVDPRSVMYDARRAERFAPEVLRFFQEMDRALGQLLDTLDRDTVLLLVSDHGFGPVHKWFHVNTWLLEEGYIVLKPGAWTRLKRAAFRIGFTPTNAYALARAVGLGRLKEEATTSRGRGRLRGLLPILFLSFEDVDWRRTRAYAMGQIGPIYFNLRGREPQGIVAPGAPAEALRAELEARLRALRDPQSGEPVVGRIYRPEELYSGPYLPMAPDIVFAPRFDAPRGQIPGFGEVDFGTNRVLAPMNRGVSGVHRMEGVFAAFGEPIRRGVWLEDCHLLDVAPTVLYLAGLPVPEDSDGRVLSEALVSGCTGPVLKGPPAARPAGPGGERPGEVLSAEDEAVVTERLRDLGYVA